MDYKTNVSTMPVENCEVIKCPSVCAMCKEAAFNMVEAANILNSIATMIGIESDVGPTREPNNLMENADLLLCQTNWLKNRMNDVKERLG